jgi:hypothetical protein
VFVFFTLILNAMCEVLRCFNEELKQLGKNDDMAEQLIRAYDKQVNITLLLRQINSTFEVRNEKYSSSESFFRFSPVVPSARQFLSRSRFCIMLARV